MNRLVVTLLAAVVLLLPALSLLGHTDTRLDATLDDQEITVTGHDERDATLHIEAASGIVLVQCPECVLDKRQSGADEHQKPTLAADFSESRFAAEEAPSRSCELSAGAPARAPPLV